MPNTEYVNFCFFIAMRNLQRANLHIVLLSLAYAINSSAKMANNIINKR